MSPSVEPFNEAKYKALMDGLECSEVSFSNIDLGDRFDAEYFTKEYLFIDNTLSKRTTIKLGELASTVASAFYPAATQLYSIGDMPFVRCVDCIDYPIMTKEQDESFEKIPYSFGKANKGISFIGKEDIIVTKVGTPCFATINAEYDEIALSRTVLGLTNIKLADPYYLMIFLRCKYGFEQLYRQRELTIQYQLTLPRVKSVNVFLTSKAFQKLVRNIGIDYITLHNKANRSYHIAEQLLLSTLGMSNFTSQQQAVSVKLFSESYGFSGRLDAEYYQPKYDKLFDVLKNIPTETLGGKNGIVTIKKSIEPGSNAYCENGIPFVRVSDVTKFGISDPSVRLPSDIVPNISSLYPHKNTILFSKDGSVGIAYKVEEDAEIITSGALLHLTVKNPQEVLPDYLTLILNSPIVQLQAERDSSGAIIQHWKPSEIEKVVIPMLDIEVQTSISEKVQESFVLRHQSKKLFEYAKRAVEIAIEQDEETAMKWLKEKGVEC